MFLRKISAVIAVLIILASASGARAQIYNNGLIDKTVALIGNESILLSQIEEQVQLMLANGSAPAEDKKMRCLVLEQTLQQKMFLNQAKMDSLVISSDMV